MRVLIVYSSNTGVTAEISERISEVLDSEGYHVYCADLKKEQPSPGGYGLVLVGSGIKMGKWNKESREYLKQNQEALKGKTALYVSYGDAAVTERLDKAQNKYLDEVAQKHGIEPVSTGLFAGCYPWSKYNFFVKQLIKGILRENGTVSIDTSEPLDYRDWDSIESWARSLTLIIGS